MSISELSQVSRIGSTEVKKLIVGGIAVGEGDQPAVPVRETEPPWQSGEAHVRRSERRLGRRTRRRRVAGTVIVIEPEQTGSRQSREPNLTLSSGGIEVRARGRRRKRSTAATTTTIPTRPPPHGNRTARKRLIIMPPLDLIMIRTPAGVRRIFTNASFLRRTLAVVLRSGYRSRRQRVHRGGTHVPSQEAASAAQSRSRSPAHRR